jgi:hypothetical protein
MLISPKTVALGSEGTTIFRRVMNYIQHLIPEDFSKYLAKNNSLRITMPGSNMMKALGAFITCV